MTPNKARQIHWTTCNICQGQGQKRRRLQKHVRRQYQNALDVYKRSNQRGTPPLRPKGAIYTCTACSGSGLLKATAPIAPDTETYPHIAIIGAGIGGVALALACLHRKIPFTLYERDDSFDARAQGYGLTLQQASKAISGLGITTLKDGIVSTKHIVHDPSGNIIGEWGMRKWITSPKTKPSKKRTNIHIARQALRLTMLEQLGGSSNVQWDHQFLNYKCAKNNQITLNFKVNGIIKQATANLVVGADGIRSSVRALHIGDTRSPLRYLDCMVILGICHLDTVRDIAPNLLDNATVFQTANGVERIYMMPFAPNVIMWQLSFPIEENAAKLLNTKGPKALKTAAIARTKWHSPIPEIVAATPTHFISGYPVYDRALLQPELLQTAAAMTLIGDAAHPMSPFKGQGANQALLDALALARTITKKCNSVTSWKTLDLRKAILAEFELEMLSRSATKVKASRIAAQILHSKAVLQKGNHPRGTIIPPES